MNYIRDTILRNKDNDTINGIIEICPYTSDKNELVDGTFDRLVCDRLVIGLYPFHYGTFPQTYAGDKDPLDMILFTDKEHKLLDIVQVDIIGGIHTIDAGYVDDKILCVERDCTLVNIKPYLKQAMKFLKKYKGKHADMQITKELLTREEAEKILKDCEREWQLNQMMHNEYNRLQRRATILQ